MINQEEINPIYWIAENVQTIEDAKTYLELQLTDEEFKQLQAKVKEWEALKDKTLEEAEQIAAEKNEEAEQHRIKFDQAAKVKAAAIAEKETIQAAEDYKIIVSKNPVLSDWGFDQEGEYSQNFDEALKSEYVMFKEKNFKATHLSVGLRNFVVVYNEIKYGDLELYDDDADNSDIDFNTYSDDLITWEIIFDENGIDVF